MFCCPHCSQLSTVMFNNVLPVSDLTVIMAIEIPGGKRNLNMNINAQQAILNAYITNNSSLYKIYSAITFRCYIATSSELYNDELQGVSIYTRLSNKRLKFKCKKGTNRKRVI